jgi:DNA-binding transcriptional ArsR family regulator
MTGEASSGDALVEVFAALANPIRLRIVATLATGGRDYVSRLARELEISRPLLHMHLQRLEAAGLIVGNLELSDDGKAMKFFEVTAFDISITPATLTEAARTLTRTEPRKRAGTDKEQSS